MPLSQRRAKRAFCERENFFFLVEVDCRKEDNELKASAACVCLFNFYQCLVCVFKKKIEVFLSLRETEAQATKFEDYRFLYKCSWSPYPSQRVHLSISLSTPVTIYKSTFSICISGVSCFCLLPAICSLASLCFSLSPAEPSAVFLCLKFRFLESLGNVPLSLLTVSI